MAKRRWATAYDRLIANLRKGSLAAGEYVSISGLVELLDLVPKRGVLVMEASPKGHAQLHGSAHDARRRGRRSRNCRDRQP